MDSQHDVFQPEPQTALRTQLGEGPIWIDGRQSLYFVDIVKKHLHRFRPDNLALKTWTAPTRPVFVLPTDGSALLVGAEDGIYLFDEEEGAFECIQTVPGQAGKKTRLNDGCVDAQGRLWFGTMDENEKEGLGTLFSFKAVPGGFDLQEHEHDFVVANGPTVSPDGATLYISDTPRGIIYRNTLTASGQLSDRKTFAQFGPDEGGPDGVVCDSEGHLWASCWGGSKIVVFHTDGSRVMEIPMPCPNVTKVAFGGGDRKTLFVTSARQNISDEVLAQHPAAGAIFKGRSPYSGMTERPFRITPL